MADLTVSKLQIAVAKTMAKAGEVAAFYDDRPGLSGYTLQNLWAVAHAAAHVAFRCTVRIEEALGALPSDQQMPLFDVPEDHAMTVKEIEDWIDAFKDVLLGERLHDDTGRGDFEQPVVATGETLAGKIKRTVFGWSGPMSRAELEQVFGDDGGIDPMVWAMVHAGELQQTDDGRLTAATAAVTLDFDAMLEAQPDLGTEAGVPADQIRAFFLGGAEPEPPELVDRLSQVIAAKPGADFDELLSALDLEEAQEEQEAAMHAALDWLFERKRCTDLDIGGYSRYFPAGEVVEHLDGDLLRQAYEQHTGQKSGRKTITRMREELRLAIADQVEADAVIEEAEDVAAE